MQDPRSSPGSTVLGDDSSLVLDLWYFFRNDFFLKKRWLPNYSHKWNSKHKPVSSISEFWIEYFYLKHFGRGREDYLIDIHWICKIDLQASKWIHAENSLGAKYSCLSKILLHLAWFTYFVSISCNCQSPFPLMAIAFSLCVCVSRFHSTFFCKELNSD